MELASAIQDEFLSCNICLENFQQPKQLPCLHTFCLRCLSQYIAKTVGQSGVLSVPCPICRRRCVPPDPDPRKLHQWADQFPDNFFVTSLRDTLEARKREQTQGDAEAASSPRDPNTRYFMGEAQTCSKHMTRQMTCYCLSADVGICELCLEETPHNTCEQTDHLDAGKARKSATYLLEKYRQKIEKVKQEVEGVKQSFSRKPRLLQTKKEEVEISVRDYFSTLRSSCAKLLLSTEKEMVDNLSRVVDDENQKTLNAEKKCDDVMTSMNHTVSLFDTLTSSGPFNAMHVLARVEGQITGISRLVTKMDEEAKADNVRFCPPSQSMEDYLASLSMGEIVVDFGSEEMAAEDLNTAGQGAGAFKDLDLSRLSIKRGQIEVSNSDYDKQKQASARSWPSLASQTPEHSSVSSVASSRLSGEQHPAVEESESYAMVPPPVDLSAPPPYFQITDDSSPPPTAYPVFEFEGELTPAEPSESLHVSSPSLLPSAPPVSELNPPAPDEWHSSCPSLADAFQRTLRMDFSCRPVTVFSGNLPQEARRGGICGAAMVDQANRAAFVDRHNHSLKIVDLHIAQIIGFLHLGELEPWDVTFVSARKELVVTCPGNRYLLFISTQSRPLTIEYYYTTRHGYCCVAHLKDDVFTGGICAPFGQPAVHVFTAQSVLREILTGEFSYPRTIFADPLGSLIMVSDWTSNAVVLATAEGQLVCRYKEAPGPKGVAMSELTGLVHVLDGKWVRLHLLDVKGQCLGTGEVEGCRDPRMVVVVPTSSDKFPNEELMVIADGNNALHAMTMASSKSVYRDVLSTV